jgi:hypothetical protein
MYSKISWRNRGLLPCILSWAGYPRTAHELRFISPVDALRPQLLRSRDREEPVF